MYIVNNTFTGAAVAIGFAHSLRVIVPGVPVKGTAVILCVGFTVLNSVGLRQSSLLNNILVAGKLLVAGAVLRAGCPVLSSGTLRAIRARSLGRPRRGELHIVRVRRVRPCRGLATSLIFLGAILRIAPIAWAIGVATLSGSLIYYVGRRIVVSVRGQPIDG